MLCFPGVHLLPVVFFHFVLMRGHAFLKSHRWFILYDGGIDAEACSRHLGWGWGGACFDSCLSLRDSAQPSVLSWQLDSDEMSQLKRGGGRLRVIPVQRSSLTRNDSGTEVVDEWDRKPIIIWRQKEKHAAMLANSVYTVLYYVKGSRFHVIWWRALNVCLQLLYIMRSKTNN